MATPATANKAKRNVQPKIIDRTPQKYGGPAQVDVSPILALLYDLPPGAMQGMRKDRPGIDDVVAELAAAFPTAGAAAGVSTAVYQSFTDHTDAIDKLRTAGAPILKLAEVITETIAIHVDARDQDLGQVVDSISSTMKRKKNAGLGAPFEKTLAYREAVAKKAAATRQKKAAAKATPAAQPPQAPAAGH
jgi:hypothetical protein